MIKEGPTRTVPQIFCSEFGERGVGGKPLERSPPWVEYCPPAQALPWWAVPTLKKPRQIGGGRSDSKRVAEARRSARCCETISHPWVDVVDLWRIAFPGRSPVCLPRSR